MYDRVRIIRRLDVEGKRPLEDAAVELAMHGSHNPRQNICKRKWTPTFEAGRVLLRSMASVNGTAVCESDTCVVCNDAARSAAPVNDRAWTLIGVVAGGARACAFSRRDGRLARQVERPGGKEFDK